MKKPIKPSTVLALALLAFWCMIGVAKLDAQTVSKARYDKTAKVLSLDENATFSYLFQLDISTMGFASKEKADEFFSNWNTDLVSFRVHFDKKTAEVQLSTRMKPDWTAKDWNRYLFQLPKQ